LDDVLYKVYPKLLDGGRVVRATRGQTRELIGVSVEIRKPRARLSRSETRGRPFGCLGELCWYLAGSNRVDFITHYLARYINESEDQETIYGAYGPRLFDYRGINQIANVIDLLRARPNTRRAVIQLFDPADISSSHIEIPCTTTLQFLVRDGLLNLVATMRSNDAYIGLPHDVFCFTMMQEIVARSVGADVGTYRHFAGSLHLYEDVGKTKNDFELVRQYMSEGLQQRIEMPPMPTGDPWPAIKVVLEVEERIRRGEDVDVGILQLDPYWADLLRLLQVFSARGEDTKIDELRNTLVFKKYDVYIRARKGMSSRRKK
jgi:thymidylate synthase